MLHIKLRRKTTPGHPQSAVSVATAHRMSVCLIEASLCLLLFAFYGYFVQAPGPNELSRYDLALALVEGHTTRIDAYEVNTIDKAHFGGSYYTDKAIGASILAVPVVEVLKHFQQLGPYGAYRAEYPVHVATRFVVALPAALAAWSLYRMARRLKVPVLDGLLIVASLSLGSAYCVFATHFFGHSLAAALGTLTASVVFFRRPDWWGWLLAGVLAGLGVLVEYPAAVAALAVGLLALQRTRAWWKDLLARSSPGVPAAGRTSRWARSPASGYVAGLALGLLPLPIYNLVSFGSPWTIGYALVEDSAFARAHNGLFGITLPTLPGLREILLGQAGLLTQSPFLVLALPGFALWLWRGRPRAEGLVSACIVVGFLVMNAGYYLPMGGQTMGSRFLVPALPFLALAIAFAPRWLRWLGLPLVAYSAVAMLGVTAVFPKASPDTPPGFLTYWWPHLTAGDLAVNWGEIRFGLEGLETLRPLGLVAGLAALGTVLLWAAECRRAAAPRTAARAVRIGLPLHAAYAILSVGTMGYLTAPLDFGSPARPPVAFAEQFAIEAPPEQLHVRFGDEFELLGYRLAKSSVQPGEMVRLDLYWRALRKIDHRYAMYVHVFGRDGEKLGGFDAVPGYGSYPAEMWPVGAVVRETYAERVAAGAAEPAALVVRVGIYEVGSMRQLLAVDERGQGLGPGPAVARLRLGHPVARPAPSGEIRASLGDVIGLADWTLPRAEYRPGETVTGTLRWRTLRAPPRDYTVFVQAVGPEGLVGQWDSQPLHGDYPTSLWPIGEEVTDSFAVPLRTDVAPGTYTLIAGLYDLTTMKRLPVGQTDFVKLGEIRVVG